MAAMSENLGPYHKNHNDIYNMRVREIQYMARLSPELQLDYKLFTIGYKLSAVNGHEELPSEDQTIKLWNTTSNDKRDQYIQEGLGPVASDVRPENFHLCPLEQNAIDVAREPGKSMLRSYLLGAKIGSHEHGFGDTLALLAYWQRNYAPVMLDPNHAETQRLRRYVELGKYVEDRKVNGDLHIEGHLPAPSHHHFFAHDADRAATDNDIITVNSVNRAAMPDGSRWVHEKMIYSQSHIQLAQGGHSERILHLFALVTEEGHIAKRMVVKIVGDEDEKRLRNELRRETNPHKRASQLKCRHILELYGLSVRKRLAGPHLGYIYMEHAPFGDLHELMNKVYQNPNKQIPEPYLWIIFRALVEALHAMHTGTVIDDTTPVEWMGVIRQNWNPIINPDIKLANIVLGNAQDDYYPAYKTAKMIDFGQAFMGENVVGDCIYGKFNMGTERICPPEQSYPPIAGFEHMPIGVHSEIYNIGLIMVSLMQGTDKEMLHASNSRFPANYTNCYSAMLEDLVSSCLVAHWNQRPTLANMVQRTRIGLKHWEKVYGSANGANLPEFMRYDEFADEQFPIGSMAPERWKGLRKRKSKEPADAHYEVPDPEVAAPTEVERPPTKKLRTADSKGSRHTLVVPPPGQGDMAKVFADLGEDMLEPESGIEHGNQEKEEQSLQKSEEQTKDTSSSQKSHEPKTFRRVSDSSDLYIEE